MKTTKSSTLIVSKDVHHIRQELSKLKGPRRFTSRPFIHMSPRDWRSLIVIALIVCQRADTTKVRTFQQRQIPQPQKNKKGIYNPSRNYEKKPPILAYRMLHPSDLFYPPSLLSSEVTPYPRMACHLRPTCYDFGLLNTEILGLVLSGYQPAEWRDIRIYSISPLLLLRSDPLSPNGSLSTPYLGRNWASENEDF